MLSEAQSEDSVLLDDSQAAEAEVNTNPTEGAADKPSEEVESNEANEETTLRDAIVHKCAPISVYPS